jgi:transcriptional regulator with GAF, ATPase, and Fis domain
MAAVALERFSFLNGSRDEGMAQKGDESLRFERFISDLSARFVMASCAEVDREINNALEKIVKFFDVDRADFAEFTEERRILILSYEYVLPGIEPFPGQITDAVLPWFTERLRSGEVVEMRRLDDFPEEAIREREYVRRSGLKASLNIPVSIGGSVIGVLSFDSFRSHRIWTDEQVKRIRMIGDIFANALQRSRAEKRLRTALREVKVLKNQLERDYSYLREEMDARGGYKRIVGESSVLKYLLFRVEQIARTDTTVLILGETGTGKELIARAIHDGSPRGKRPLVKVNCAVLSNNLIESELFGHEKGAFSGAADSRSGRFEVADGTTLFLDEVGELPAASQAKLLRVLEEGEFERLGSSHTKKVNIRVVAASNRDLEMEVEQGLFRKDLWYRLNVFPITVPPLRDRREDIPLLVDWLARDICGRMGRRTPKIPQKAIRVLQAYDWPGNVRELRNVIERSLITTQGDALDVGDFPGPRKVENGPSRRKKSLEDLEREYIFEVLEQTRWRVHGPEGAARILGLHPSTLRSRMQKLGVERPP